MAKIRAGSLKSLSQGEKPDGRGELLPELPQHELAWRCHCALLCSVGDSGQAGRPLHEGELFVV